MNILHAKELNRRLQVRISSYNYGQHALTHATQRDNTLALSLTRAPVAPQQAGYCTLPPPRCGDDELRRVAAAVDQPAVQLHAHSTGVHEDATRGRPHLRARRHRSRALRCGQASGCATRTPPQRLCVAKASCVVRCVRPNRAHVGVLVCVRVSADHRRRGRVLCELRAVLLHPRRAQRLPRPAAVAQGGGAARRELPARRLIGESVYKHCV